jgi:type II secretion system protein G
MYAGSKVTVDVAGTKVVVEQKTDYPWKEHVTIVVHLAEPKQFTVYLRVPRENASPLYTSNDPGERLGSYLTQSMSTQNLSIEPGRLVLSKKWKDGDRIELNLPHKPQRIKADERIAADRGRVALRYGPLIYCIESVDQNIDSVLPPDEPLATEWRPDLLDGVVVIRSKFMDGKPMLAIPYYARANRGGRYAVWIRDPVQGDAAKVQLRTFDKAINGYKADIGEYPRSLDALTVPPAELPAGKWEGPYIEDAAVPKDPWGKTYQYAAPGKHNPDSYDVWTVDPNGNEIGNWKHASKR